MWLLRAFRDAVIATVLTAWRGWRAWVLHPVESALLVGALPGNLWRTRNLLGELFGTGLIVATAATDGSGSGLRTAIVGLGDLTTRVVEGPALTRQLTTAHFEAVRARLAPLTNSPDALFRASALLMAPATVIINHDTKFDCRDLSGVAFDLFGSVSLISFGWALSVRLIGPLLRRAVRGWFARARAR